MKITPPNPPSQGMVGRIVPSPLAGEGKGDGDFIVYKQALSSK